MEKFDFDHARGLKRDLVPHLGNVVVTAGVNGVDDAFAYAGVALSVDLLAEDVPCVVLMTSAATLVSRTLGGVQARGGAGLPIW